MMTQSSVNNLSGKTGTSQSAIMRLLPLAIPILIKYLTKNAQSQQGALSLLGALTQHKNTNSMELQLADADADDGDKILNHILGGNYGNVMNQLAGQSGMSEDQVSSVLANIAPALLSVRCQHSAAVRRRRQSRKPYEHVRRRCTAAAGSPGTGHGA